MEYKDYYQTLGVNKQATDKEIKSAYRKLARQYHPDVNADPGAENRFKEINEAYEVLGDKEKRAKYDHLGADWQRWQQSGGGPGNFDWSQWQTAGDGERVHVRYGTPEDLGDLFGRGSDFGSGSPFSDFFETIFGGRGGQASGFEGFRTGAQSRRGQDVQQEVEISLTEAYQGTTRLLEIDGRRLSVKIPAGAETGTKVRIRGQGQDRFSGGQPGDLYLRVKVAPDPRFERKRDNLHTTVPVDLYTAVLGGEVRIPTLSGEVKLKIPAGTQNGQTFRLRGKGMPNLRRKNQSGDLHARVEVRLPDKLNAKQKALFEQLREMAE